MADAALTEKIQAIMDQSAAKAGPVQKGVVSNPAWKADAAKFLETWEKAHFAVVTTVGPNGQPHSAVVESVKFQPDGTLITKMYTGSVRRKDLQSNPRLSVVKTEGGAALTLYGTGQEVEGTVQQSFGGETVELRITPNRIFAIIPQQRPADAAAH